MSKLPFEKMNAFILVPYSVLSGRLAIILANYNSVYGEHQGRSQTSEQDGASFERPRREPLGGRGMGACPPPPKILKSRGTEMLF